MADQKCAACSESLTPKGKFCPACGVPVGKGSASLHHTRTLISNWVMPFNATLIFGGTVVAILDFLSPRFKALPILAGVSFVVFLAVLIARQLFAAHLAQGSKARWLFAPGSTWTNAPAVIVAGVLALLTISGAAWSSATADEGGIIASRSDYARSAQSELGILKDVQKEQRVQTSLLQDIRDGRSNSPRKQLANQSIAFEPRNFMSAISRGDIKTTELFLKGGMDWRLAHAQIAIEKGQEDIAKMLLEYPDSYRADSRCSGFIIQIMIFTNKGEQRALPMTAIEKTYLKRYCKDAKVEKSLSDDIAYRQGLDPKGDWYIDSLKLRLDFIRT